MDFSNPAKPTYTWSRARSNSLNEFIDGNLAVHFAYASQYEAIQKKNPHLNFAVTQVPLPRGTTRELTFAKVHGLSVLKSSKNKATALVAVQRLLLDPEPAKEFAAAYNLPPVRRDMLAAKPTDAVLSVFYDAAIRASTWLDPRPEETNRAFQTMVESVSSGRDPVDMALVGLHTALLSALAPYRAH
jgi:ABC-type glycerol-3-phosphate transport system substrate-binding protein